MNTRNTEWIVSNGTTAKMSSLQNTITKIECNKIQWADNVTLKLGKVWKKKFLLIEEKKII